MQVNKINGVEFGRLHVEETPENRRTFYSLMKHPEVYVQAMETLSKIDETTGSKDVFLKSSVTNEDTGLTRIVINDKNGEKVANALFRDNNKGDIKTVFPSLYHSFNNLYGQSLDRNQRVENIFNRYC